MHVTDTERKRNRKKLVLRIGAWFVAFLMVGGIVASFIASLAM